jgi:hypothetical protein
MVEQNCSPHGSQEAERERNRLETRHDSKTQPSDIIPPIRPHCSIMPSEFESTCGLIH